jgi:hypothetical protein
MLAIIRKSQQIRPLLLRGVFVLLGHFSLMFLLCVIVDPILQAEDNPAQMEVQGLFETGLRNAAVSWNWKLEGLSFLFNAIHTLQFFVTRFQKWMCQSVIASFNVRKSFYMAMTYGMNGKPIRPARSDKILAH